MSWLSGSFDFTKAVNEWPARYFLAFAFVPGATLAVLGSPLVVVLGLQGIPALVRLGLLLATLAFLAVAITKAATHHLDRREAKAAKIAAAESAKLEIAASEAAQREEAQKRVIAFEQRMRNLTPWECKVIASFIDQTSRVATFLEPGMLSHTAYALAGRGYLSFVANEQNAWYRTSTFEIAEPIFAFFQQHPELLERGRQLEEG